MNSAASATMRALASTLRGVIALGVIATVQHGCNSDAGDEGANNPVQAYANTYRRQARLACTCDDPEDEPLCVEARLNAFLDSCVRSALDDSRAAMTLSCFRQAVDRQTECLSPDACDADLSDDCFSDYLDDVDDCPELPDDLQNDVDDCPRLFECVSGKTVDYDLLCDGYEDCDDGSDELPC